MKFALIGVAGYIARKHLVSIINSHQNLVASYDISESVGILDDYFPDCEFFNNQKDFLNFLDSEVVDALVICSPNHNHYEHIQIGLEREIDVICEKPLVIKSTHYNSLKDKEGIYPLLQFRGANLPTINNYELNYLTARYYVKRGNWYQNTWKSQKDKSGGINFNIGIHLFDIACNILGRLQEVKLYDSNQTDSMGLAVMEKGFFQWHISVNKTIQDRSISLNNKPISLDFSGLHEKFYREFIYDKERLVTHIDIKDTMNFIFELEKYEKVS